MQSALRSGPDRDGSQAVDARRPLPEGFEHAGYEPFGLLLFRARVQTFVCTVYDPHRGTNGGAIVNLDRYWIQALPAADLRVRVRTGGRPLQHYAVILECRVSGFRPRWRAIYMIDNHRGICHMHRYHGATKLGPERFPAGVGLATNEQLANAIRHMIERHGAIFAGWRRRSRS